MPRKSQPKVKVQLLANLSGFGLYMQIVERAEDEAEMLVENGYARYVDSPPPKKGKAKAEPQPDVMMLVDTNTPPAG